MQNQYLQRGALHAMFATALLFVAAQPAQAANKLIMNYRAGHGAESWTTPYTALGTWIGSIPTPTGAERSQGERYERDVEVFNGTTSYARMANLANVDTDDGLTLQAWFYAYDTIGKQAIFSNTQSAGYTLRLEDKRLVGLVNVSGTYYKVRSPANIQAYQMYKATFIVDFAGSGIEGSNGVSGRTEVRLRLIVDGQAVATSTYSVSSSARIRNSSVAPLIGAEPGASGEPTGWYFNGFVEAVTVRNYPIEYISGTSVAERFFEAGSPRDGTIHSGQPSYWDHEWSHTLDERLSPYDSQTISIHGLTPFVNDEYVAQGVAHSCEAGQSCSQERLYLSLYWHSTADKEATDDDFRDNHSLIAEMDPDSGQVLRCFRLSGKLADHHVGGIAYRGGSIYVASNWKIERYPLPNTGPNTGYLLSCPDIAPSGSWDVRASSALSYVRAGTAEYLLASRFCENDDNCNYQDTNPAKPYAYLYPLDSNGNISGDYLAKYRLPYKAQGADVYFGANGPELVVSTSFGDNSSYVRRYMTGQAYCPLGDSCGVAPELTTARLETPAGLEDLSVVGNKLWSVSESGGRYFQRRTHKTPWSDFFPFFFSMTMAPGNWE